MEATESTQSIISNESKNILVHFLPYCAILLSLTAILLGIYESTFAITVLSRLSVLFFLGLVLFSLTSIYKKKKASIVQHNRRFILIGFLLVSAYITLAACIAFSGKMGTIIFSLFCLGHLNFFIGCWKGLLKICLGFFIVSFLVFYFFSVEELDYVLMAVVISIACISGYFALQLTKVLSNGFKHVEYLQKQEATLQANLKNEDTKVKMGIERIGELKQKLSSAKIETEAAMMAKTEFLATVSHEIRTPLNGLLPILELLRDTKLDREQLSFLKTAYVSAQQLLRIINDILDFSKVDVGKLQLENIEVDLKALIISVLDLMDGNAQRRGITLNYSIGNDIPRFVRSDPVRLRQIITNLVGNSIKFTEQGGVTVEVTRRREKKKEIDLLFSIKDTGVGMSPKTASRLFKSFSQADASTTRTHGGTGLGLAICKRLVDLMGGDIGVRSKTGTGSVFWFSLPFRKSIRDMPAKRHSLAGARVIILNNNELETTKLTELLVSWEIIVHTETVTDALLSQLKSSFALGEGWAFDLLLISISDDDKEMVNVVTKIKSLEALSDLEILIVTEKEGLPPQLKAISALHEIKNPYTEGLMQATLIRALDVADDIITESEASQEQNPIFADSVIDDWAEVATKDAEQLPSSFTGTVLVVEDNPVNLTVSRKLLIKLDLMCDVAEDGKQALEKIAKKRYDLIFMDCQMPILDGYSATRMIRKQELEKADGFRLPIIAMTANAMMGDRKKCINAGMDDYLSKPVNRRKLLTVLEKWLKSQDPQKNTKNNQNIDEFAKLSDKAILSDACDNVLDYEILDELRELMEEEFTDVLLVYMDNAPKLFNKISQAADKGDIKGLISPAHSLKSSSGNVGAMQVSNFAKGLEQAARSNDFEEAAKNWRGLQQVFPKTYEKLTELLTTYKL